MFVILYLVFTHISYTRYFPINPLLLVYYIITKKVDILLLTVC